MLGFHKKVLVIVMMMVVSSIYSGLSSAANASPQFMSYWFSWGQNNNTYVYPKLSDVPAGVTMVAIAFALEQNGQLELQNSDNDQLKQSIQALHSRGVKVLLSSGGATSGYPWDVLASDPDKVVSQFTDFINDYSVDGIDFDIESFGAGFKNLPDIIGQLKQAFPNLIITITAASTGSLDLNSAPPINAQLEDLAQQLYQKGQLNYLDVMNYDQYWTPETCSYDTDDLGQNCYIQNIQVAEQMVLPWTGNNQDKAKLLIMNGIMIGKADDNKTLLPGADSSIDITKICQWLAENHYGAVMSWGVSRDQDGSALSSSTGVAGYSQGAFTQAMIHGIVSQSNGK